MRRYLVVDDNRAFAENLAEILRDDGDEVVVTTSGKEALAAAAARPFDALVTDMRMPVMGGARLVHEIRRMDPGLPAIVVTAYTGDDDLDSARREGLLAVLPKPVPLAQLRALMSGARRNGLVAIVEDDVDLCDNLGEAFRGEGFTTVYATSVTEAERLGPVAPFAGLVDLRVPGGPSGEALRRLLTTFPELPILVMTAYDTESLEDLGVDPVRVLQKPFDTASLLQELKKLHEARASAVERAS